MNSTYRCWPSCSILCISAHGTGPVGTVACTCGPKECTTMRQDTAHCQGGPGGYFHGIPGCRGGRPAPQRPPASPPHDGMRWAPHSRHGPCRRSRAASRTVPGATGDGPKCHQRAQERQWPHPAAPQGPGTTQTRRTNKRGPLHYRACRVPARGSMFGMFNTHAAHALPCIYNVTHLPAGGLLKHMPAANQSSAK